MDRNSELTSMIVQLIALAGGGGSGGGGGGGAGGGSSGAGGNALGFFIIISILYGFFASLIAIAYLFPPKDKDKHGLQEAARGVIGTSLASLPFLLVDTEAIAGQPLPFLFETDFYVWLSIFTGIAASYMFAYAIPATLRRIKARKANKVPLSFKMYNAGRKDPVWDRHAIKKYIPEVFVRFQADWANFDTEKMKSYLTPEYHRHVILMLAALKQLHRQNKVEGAEVTSQYLVDVVDADNNSHDTFTFQVNANARDVLVQQDTGEVLYDTKMRVRENWTFARIHDEWKLAGINQLTAEPSQEQITLRQFAKDHGMFYSLDMGRLFVPRPKNRD